MSSLKMITEERYISRFFRNLSRHKEVPVQAGNGEKKFDANLLFSPRRGSEPSIKIQNSDIQFSIGQNIEISLSNREVIFLFQAKITSAFNGVYTIEKPTVLFTSFRRSMSRYRFEEREKAMVFFHDLDKSYPILDISTMGISFFSDGKDFKPGQFCRDVLLELESGIRVFVDLKIKQYRISRVGKFIFGSAISPKEWSTQYKIFDYVFKKIFSNLQPINEIQETQLLKLIESSGLIESQEGKQHMLHRCFNAYHNKPLISNSLVHRRSNEALAMGVVLRVFNRTFIGNQLLSSFDAKTNSKPTIEVFMGLSDFLLNHPYCENYLSYITEDVERMREMYLSIDAMIRDKNKFLLDKLELYSFSSRHWKGRPSQYKYECTILDHPEDFLQFIHENIEPIEVNTYGFTKKNIHLIEIKQIFNAYGYYVARQIWSIKKGENSVAYAVAHCYSEEVSAFPNINQCRIYFKVSGAEIKEILSAFLPQLVLFYNKYDRENFYITFKAWDKIAKDISLPGLRYISTIGRIMANREGIKEYKKMLAANIAYIPTYYPLTHPQLAIWYTEKVFPDTSFGNIAGMIRIKEAMDFTLLDWAINLVIQKNEGIRLRISDEESQPKQYFSQYKYIKIDFFDFSRLRGEEGLAKWDEGHTSTGFNLIDSDLFYFGMIKLNENEGGFYVKMHHIISDAWTMVNLIISKIIENYILLKKGMIISKKRKPSYLDYILSEQEFLNSDRFQAQKNYWDSKFETLPELMHIGPINGGKRETRAIRMSFALSKELSEKINSFYQDTKYSPFTIFMAAFSIYLSKITNKSDMVIGTPVLNRGNSKEKETVGMFISVVPLRLLVNPQMNFINYLKAVSKESKQAFKNQKYPYDMILKDFRDKHRVSENLYDVVLSFQNAQHIKAEVDSHVDWIFNGHQTDSLAIHIGDRENENQYFLDFDYLASVFSEEEIERLFEHLQNILKDAIHNPEKKLCELEILSEDEKRTLLADFNNTWVDFPRDQCIHELFEAQAQRTPNHLAVVFQEERLTYRELNEKANQLARVLQKKGVKTESVVGIMAIPSTYMLIGIMAILKAGAAYVPIDPEYPEERILYILEDSKVQVLLLNECLEKHIEFNGEKILLEGSNGFYEPHIDLGPTSKSNHLSYIIYTSGSTGVPKGVMIEHRALVNLCFWHNRTYGVTEKDRAAKYAGFGFDASVWEIFPYLISGATIYMIHQNIKMNMIQLNEYFERQGITITFLPTQICEQFIELENNSLRILLTGADKLKKYSSKNYHLVNNYGPTENTVVTTSFFVDREYSNIPIGAPIDNTKVYILGSQGELKPVGVPGELCISGEGLARGYINNPQLTQEKFVLFPRMNEKIYRTGDLARWLPDGNLEFLGRMDNQVKIRGYRIELGEIEIHLLKCKHVVEGVVVAKKDQKSDSYLCAYIVSNQRIQSSQLRMELLQKLPDYMIPANFILVDSLPLTPNGKIDRKKLEALKDSMEETRIFIAPTNQGEKELCKVWSSLFNVDKIGIADNFFELGGDSLLAINMVSNLYRDFQVEISISEIFSNPTVAQLAPVIQRKSRNGYIPIKQADKKEFYPASSAQSRMFLLNKMDETGIQYNMPGAMLLDGEIEVERLEEAFTKLLKRHEAFRTSFHLVQGEITQKIQDEVDFNLERLEIVGEENSKAIEEKFIRPFDLGKAPLIRVAFIKLPGNQNRLLLDMHHIISDGISIGIVIKDLMDLYSHKNLESLAVQYKDFSVWQKQELQSSKIKVQGTYWQKAFQGELPALNMPLDYQRPNIQNFEGDRINFQIEPELTRAINELAIKTETTLLMVLFSAYNVLLSKYTGQEDIIVGSPISGRRHPQLDQVIGMFVNTLALRSFPSEDKTFLGFMEELRENLLKAYENQDYPFEELVEKLSIPRDAGRNPLFDTMFSLQNKGMTEMELEGNKLVLNEMDFKISKFDFSLIIFTKENKIEFTIEYSTKLFKKETMERMGGHFIQLMKSITHKPEAMLSDLNMITAEEEHRILIEFNRTETENKNQGSIIRLFEEQVDKNPTKAAVIYQDKMMTYVELNEKVNQLAWALLKKGVKPGVQVGIMIERSLEMAVGILAILKAGGAYLPIEPDFGEERIGFMMEDSGTTILLTTLRNKHRLPDIGTIVFFEDQTMEEQSRTNPKGWGEQDKPAYIIYTSGSTGKPKGVRIHERALLNLCSWYRQEYSIEEESKVLLIIPYCFDASVKNLITPLISGGSLILGKSGNYDATEILDTIYKNRVTLINCVPSAIYPVIELAEKKREFRKLASVEYLLLGGEGMSISRLIPWLKEGTCRCKLGNIYGPTECTDISTHYLISPMEYDHLKAVPIGKPIYNVKAYILDTRNKIQPIGVVGEICISGEGLAQGYIHREELTKAKFVAHPLIPGAGMYKTGDYGKWLADGNIEFVGRMDQQVKNRGFRIELEEIEQKLLQHGEVKEAVVKVIQGKNEATNLCAYVVPHIPIDIQELKNYLTKELPPYMVPAFFVNLDQLPLTTNGKIDRKALPQPQVGKDYADGNEPLEGDTETKLARIWEEVLGIAKVSPGDNFFEIGGDSLSAMRVLTAALVYNWNLSIQDFYLFKTLRGLSRKIQGGAIQVESNQKDLMDHISSKPIQSERSNSFDTAGLPLRNILLTGGTGFLGIHILRDLLEETDLKVYCLIRGKDRTNAEERLRELLKFYFKKNYEVFFGQRIFPIVGNVSKIRFGLEEEEYMELGEKIDAVIHSAALVKHYGDYQEFEKMNVYGTKEVVKLSRKFDLILYHVSTTSVSGTKESQDGNMEIFTERDFYIGQDYTSNVYVRSKFEAENLIYKGMELGLKGSVFRVGNLTGRYIDGVFQLNIHENRFYNLLKFTMELGIAPESLWTSPVEFTPVDYCSKAIVKLMTTKGSLGGTFHLMNHHKILMEDLFKTLEHLEIPIKKVENKDFIQWLKETSKQKDGQTVISGIINDIRALDTVQTNSVLEVSSQWTDHTLNQIGFSWPNIDEAYRVKVVKYIQERGFLKKM